MRQKLLFVLVLGFAGTAWAQAPAPTGKPTVAQVCLTCHKPETGQLRGVFENVAFKSQSIQLKIDAHTEIVRFDSKSLKVVDGGDEMPGEKLRDIAKNREARIEFVDRDGARYATLISFKGPIKIAPEKLVKYDAVAKLVAQGPEQGNYTLVDSRPLPRFQEGAIPTAINIPYPAFDKFADRLPQDKARLVVFYCSGITCTMSPKSMQRAESMGYTNVRVYREGMPEWAQRNYGVLSPQFFKEAYVDKQIPVVLLDVRVKDEAQRTGFVPGAVAMSADQIKAALKTFPDKKLKAPIMVYDGTGKDEALAAARTLVAAGVPNVNVITGGLAGWQGAGYALATGAPGQKIAYVPKPRPGEITIAEFTKIAGSTPADTLILDVRNNDEASAGMIKGAKLVPDEELAARMAEVPKDKKIVTHCLTGVRAEMAYHKLKEAGYEVRFLNAEIDVARDGKFKITPK